MPGNTAREAETAEVLLVAVQAGPAAGSAATASPTAAAVAEVANFEVSQSGGGPTSNEGHRLCRTAGPTRVGPQRAPSVGDTAKEGTRSSPNMQNGVVESRNACSVALQHVSHASDSQSTRTALGKVAYTSMQFPQGHHGRFERMLDTLQTLPIPRVDAE